MDNDNTITEATLVSDPTGRKLDDPGQANLKICLFDENGNFVDIVSNFQGVTDGMFGLDQRISELSSRIYALETWKRFKFPEDEEE